MKTEIRYNRTLKCWEIVWINVKTNEVEALKCGFTTEEEARAALSE